MLKLTTLLTNLLDDRLQKELLAAERMDAVLREAEVKTGQQVWSAKLPLLLFKVTGTHDAHEIPSFSELLQHAHDLVWRSLCGHGQRSIHVEEHERPPPSAKQVSSNRSANEGRGKDGSHGSAHDD